MSDTATSEDAEDIESALMKPEQAAAYLTLSVTQVRRKAQSGELRSYKLGPKLIRFKRHDLDAYLDANLAERDD